jgi:hypothetical protein
MHDFLNLSGVVLNLTEHVILFGAMPAIALHCVKYNTTR